MSYHTFILRFFGKKKTQWLQGHIFPFVCLWLQGYKGRLLTY